VNQSIRVLLGTLLLLAVGATSFAQGWAVPAKTPDTPVSCGACPGVDPASMTIGYHAPISTFTGRFLDSTNTSEWFAPFRTARAYMVLVRPDIDRIYFRYGNGSVAAYSLSRFFTRLEGGEALLFPISPRPANRGSSPEVFLNWDDWFNPEISQWNVFNIDGGTRMTGFDVDDKGYVYVASTIFGWGIVKDSLAAGGRMQSVTQMCSKCGQTSPPTYGHFNDATPGSIISLKGATRYYAFINAKTQPYWDVTDRANPVKLPVSVPNFTHFAKTTAGDRVALVDEFGNLVIYTADGLATGAGPLFTDAGYEYVSGDGTNFYGLKDTSSGRMIVAVAPSGTSTYAIQASTPLQSNMLVSNFHYGDGYVVLTGSDEGGGWDLRLYKMGANFSATLIQIPGFPSNAVNQTYPGYFRNYYGAAPPGVYVKPAYVNMWDGTVYKAPSGKVYLIACAGGLGDVYELAGGDTIAPSNDGRAGRTNVNAPVSTKIVYGDPVQFTAKTTSATIQSVAWNFGNPEAGTTNSQQTTPPNFPIIYQFSNLTKTSIGTKSVTASNITDSQIRGTVPVTLEMPVARFGLAGTGTKYLFAQPNASSSAPIVAGDSFVDESDGTIESHYASWALDGTVTKATADQPIDVGQCGAHSVVFTGYYGPYSGAGATLTTTHPSAPVIPGDFIVGLDANNGAVNYSVRPFAAALDFIGVSGPNLIFRSSSRGLASPLLTASLGFTWTWELLTAAGAPLLTQTGSVATVPDFLVPTQSTLGLQNLRVRLTLRTNAPLQGSCAGFETTAALSNPISAPDPKISQIGDCQGAPCTFSVTSVNGTDMAADKWTFAWSITPAGFDPTTVLSGASMTTSFQKIALYTVTITATNAVGTGTASTTVNVLTAANPCGKLTNSSFVPSYSGSSGCSPYSTCASGESLTFFAAAPQQGGYDPSCSPNHTYTWSFPDGSQAIGQTVTKAATVSGTVTLNVNNGGDNHNYTVALNVGTITPPPPTCGTLTALNVQPFWSGVSCPSGGPTCGTNDLLTFDVQAYQYNFSGCASFKWDFGEGAPSFTQRAVHSFTQSRSQTINLTVSGPGGTVNKTITITTSATTTPPSTCPTMTGSNVAITYSAPSGCTPGNPCKNGESVTFDVTSFAGYDFSCAQHQYSWNFGDGSAAVTSKQAPHTFATSGSHVVTVTISNPSQQNFQRTLTMTTSDSTGNCGPINPNLNLFISYANGSSTCSQNGGDCATGEAVNFTVLSYQYDLGCATHTFDWDFGDGSTHVSTKDTPHQYAAQGTYTVKCIVSNGGTPVTLTQSVSVKGGPPILGQVVVSYAVAPLTGVPNGFLFTASFDRPDLVKSWQWDFGDGTKSPMRHTGDLMQEPKIYADSKTYTVTLSAYDSSGSSAGPPATHPGELKRRSVRH
jgi:PKD repeat protein